MAKTELVAFDYSKVDADTKGKLIALAGAIGRDKKSGAKVMLSLGESISTAHELLAKGGKDGMFSEWVERECGFERTTAYNYLWAFKRFSNCSTIEQFSPTSMYLLSAPESPNAASAEAEKRAGKGEKITVAKAKEILSRFKTPKTGSAPRSAAPTTQAETRKPSLDAVVNASVSPPAAGSAAVIEGPCLKGGEHDFDDDGDCKKCKEPNYGKDQPAPVAAPVNEDSEPEEPDSGKVSTQRSKTVKTVEALMRAFDDLNEMLPKPNHKNAIAACKSLLTAAKEWK